MRRTHFLPALLIFAFLPSSPALPDDPTSFSLATFNINFGNPDLPGILVSIRAARPDVLFLQETNPASERFLRKALAETYPHLFFHAAPGPGGFAVLSTVPFPKPTYLPPQGGICGALFVRLTFPDRDLLVVNTHLMPTTPQPNSDPAAILALFAKTEATRSREIRAILAKLPPRWPVVLLGDLNSPPQLSSVPGFLTVVQGFTDSLVGVLPDPDSIPTWHWKLPNLEYRTRLDYIFSTRLLARSTAARVIPSDASDHFLVTCSYQWRRVPVTLGSTTLQARSVLYLLDAASMTPERLDAARSLIAHSIPRLDPDQCFRLVCPAETPLLIPPLPGFLPATSENCAPLAAPEFAPVPAFNEKPPVQFPAPPVPPGLFLPALRDALKLLADEPAPKTLFIISDRLASDPVLFKSARSLLTDKRLQSVFLTPSGDPISPPTPTP